MLITMPNPGTISLPLGASGTFSVTDVVVVLDDVLGVVDSIDVDDWIVAVMVDTVRSCAITGSVRVTGALMTLFGFSGLIGLTGLVTLLTLLTVILHVLYISDHAVQVGEPYGSEHIERLCSCTYPS